MPYIRLAITSPPKTHAFLDFVIVTVKIAGLNPPHALSDFSSTDKTVKLNEFIRQSAEEQFRNSTS